MKIVSEIYINDYSVIPFFLLNKRDQKEILHLRNNKKVKNWMLNKKTISLEDHLKFCKSLSLRSDCQYFAVRKNCDLIGVVYLTNIKDKTAEIGLYKNPEKMQKVGAILLEILETISRMLMLRKLKLHVLKENSRALNLYKKFKYRSIREECEYILMEKEL